jgi:putative ABC transport system substrate-binding protein
VLGEGQLDRRKFVSWLGGAGLAQLSHAQPATKLHRIGVIYEGGPWEAVVHGMVAGLKESGLVEGKNFVLHLRNTKGSLPDVEPAAKQLMAERVDLIFAVATSVTVATKKATRDVPIVFFAGSDPVRYGLVKSYNQPGDRLTGVVNPATDGFGKRLDILKQILPSARRVITFHHVDSQIAVASLTRARGIAAKLGLELIGLPIRSIEEVVAGVRALRVGEVDAYTHGTDAMVISATPRIIDPARERKLPVIVDDVNAVSIGVLAAYGVNYFDLGYFASKQVQRVLAGARPQDLPVQAYDKVQLGLNLRVARELGITVPQSVLLRADQIIR